MNFYKFLQEQDLNNYDIQTGTDGVPIMMSFDKVIRKIDNATYGRIDLQVIRRALSKTGDITVLIEIEARKLKGWDDSDVDSDHADLNKNEVVIDGDLNIIDGRHRTSKLAKQNKKIFAYMSVRQHDLMIWYKS